MSYLIRKNIVSSIIGMAKLRLWKLEQKALFVTGNLGCGQSWARNPPSKSIVYFIPPQLHPGKMFPNVAEGYSSFYMSWWGGHLRRPGSWRNSSRITSLIDLCSEFLAGRTIQLNVPQVPQIQHLLNFLPRTQTAVLSAPAFPGETSEWQSLALSCPKELATSYPESFILHCPLFSQASNSKFSCFYFLNLSEIHPFFSTLLLLSPGLVKASFLFGFIPPISFSVLSLLLPLWVF